MKASTILWAVIVFLTAIVIVLTFILNCSYSFGTLSDNSNKNADSCDRVQLHDFFGHLNESVNYRAECEGKFYYHNQILSLVWNRKNRGFLRFSCHRPSGSTCDVYTVWIDAAEELHSARNVLENFFINESLEYNLGTGRDVDGKGTFLSICDPGKRVQSRYKLVPLGGDLDFRNSSGFSCAAGGHFDGAAKECKLSYLNETLEHANFNSIPGISLASRVLNRIEAKCCEKNKKKAVRDSSKRILFISIALLTIVGITFILKQIYKCINDVTTIKPSQKMRGSVQNSNQIQKVWCVE